MRVFAYILLALIAVVLSAVVWAVIVMKRDPMTRTIKAWSRLTGMAPAYVRSLSIGPVACADGRNCRDLLRAVVVGVRPYRREWENGMVGQWGDPVAGCVEFTQGKTFRFFIRFNLNEPSVAFFLDSLPHPFGFGTRELALVLKQTGITENVNWQETP